MSSNSPTVSGGMNCETCQAGLADYVRTELNGQAADEAYAEVAFHMQTCKDCEAAYYREFRSQGQLMSVAALRQVGDRSQVAKAMQRILAAPEPMPAPKPGWQELALEQGRAWLEQATGLWRQVELPLAAILGTGQTPAPALAGLLAAETDEPSSVKGSLDVAPTGATFEIKLNVVSEPTPAGEDECRVNVALTLLNRFGDFSGAKITLLWGDAAHTEVTDALGIVSFSQLPCDQLRSMSLTVVFPQ